jgi:DNA-binding XRE family transcriptional regulator
MTVTVSVLDVAEVRAGLGVSRERMARLLDVAARTVDRWEKRGALPASERQRQELARLAEIAALGRVVFTEEGFGRFLVTPLPALGGRSALAAIEAGEADRVLGLLAGLYEGEPA